MRAVKNEIKVSIKQSESTVTFPLNASLLFSTSLVAFLTILHSDPSSQKSA